MEYVELYEIVLDQQQQGPQGTSAQGTWCESHIMAPAVCILNPSNGAHNCRPGGGLRWVRSPTAAHCYKHALARSSKSRFRAALGRRKFEQPFREALGGVLALEAFLQAADIR
jgi:hypothetical protein